MSELSTVAIKDGHRGHPHHLAQGRFPFASSGNNNNSLDAERADRISRLAGLERLGAVRQSSSSSLPPGASANHPLGYFESPIPPQTYKERSTVGSASATGSAGGAATWASGSDAYDQGDKMSEDQDQEIDTSSNGGFSDEGNGSLVGFGEGAGSTMGDLASTTSGARTPQRQTPMGTPTPSKVGGTSTPTHVRESSGMSS